MGRTKSKKKRGSHYVDKKEFYEEMCEFIKQRKKDPKCEVPPCIAKKLHLIVNNYSYNYNFINYTFKDNMISEALFNCLRYIDNFNPEISKNPFAYFTQITWSSFVKVIKEEKKVSVLKKKLLYDFIEKNQKEREGKINKRNMDNINLATGSKDFTPVTVITPRGRRIPFKTEKAWLDRRK